jgi:kynureninase
MAQGYEPEAGIGGWLTGSPSVLSLAAVEEGVALVAEAGIDRIRAKGTALTGYALGLHDAWLAPLGCRAGSPRDPARRGSHVAIRHPAAAALCERLMEGGVIPDFRAPDSIRLGMSPLTTSFRDVHTGFVKLRALLATTILA